MVRALRMARSDAAGGAGWRDLTGKLVFPGPVVLWRSGAPRAGYGGLPATTVGVPVPSLAPPATEPPPVDAVSIPLLRGLEPELEVLPEAVFGQGLRGVRGRRPHPGGTGLGRRSGAGDRPLRGDPGGAQRRCAHHGAQRRRVAVAADGGRVVLAPLDADGLRAALEMALRSGEPGSAIAVAAPAHLLLVAPRAAAEWWPAVRTGTVRMVSIDAEDGATDCQLLARLVAGRCGGRQHRPRGSGSTAVLAAGAAAGPAGERAPTPGLQRRPGRPRPRSAGVRARRGGYGAR